jgi:hypothetical protein
MLPDPLQEYLDRCSKSERGKVLKAVAMLSTQSTFEQAVRAVTEALQHGVQDVDSLVAIHNRITGIIPQLGPVRLPVGIPELTAFRFDAGEYDKALLQGGGRSCN